MALVTSGERKRSSRVNGAPITRSAAAQPGVFVKLAGRVASTSPPFPSPLTGIPIVAAWLEVVFLRGAQRATIKTTAGDGFWLDDGSGAPVHVRCTNTTRLAGLTLHDASKDRGRVLALLAAAGANYRDKREGGVDDLAAAWECRVEPQDAVWVYGRLGIDSTGRRTMHAGSGDEEAICVSTKSADTLVPSAGGFWFCIFLIAGGVVGALLFTFVLT